MFKTERTGAIVVDIPKKYQHLYWSVAVGGTSKITQYEHIMFNETEGLLFHLVTEHNCMQTTLEKMIVRDALRVISHEYSALVKLSVELQPQYLKLTKFRVLLSKHSKTKKGRNLFGESL
mgnify:CR=1 FL=1